MKWLKHRCVEPSTWAALSMWFLVAGVYSFTFWPWWRSMLLGAALCATAAAILQEKGPRT